MNKAILFGNVGKDPESRKINETTVTKFSLATNRTYTDASGDKKTETQWHNIVFWGKTAEIASKYVKKGSSIIVEGEIQYRSYENKEGQKVYITEILGDKLHFVGSKQDDKPQSNEQWNGKKEVKSMSDINELPGAVDDQINTLVDLPF